MTRLTTEAAETLRAELKIGRAGFTISELSAIVGRRFSSVADYLNELRAEGLAVYVHGFPSGGRWCAPEHASAIQASYDATRVESAANVRANKKAYRARARLKANQDLRTAAVMLAKRNMVLQAVLYAGLDGISCGELCARFCVPEGTLRKHLLRFRNEGKIEKNVPTGWTVRWGPVGIAAHHASAWERNQRHRARRKMRKEERLAVSFLSDEPIRVWVDAREVEPLRPAGPASVWALGA
jgi:hypothetical protein